MLFASINFEETQREGDGRMVSEPSEELGSKEKKAIREASPAPRKTPAAIFFVDGRPDGEPGQSRQAKRCVCKREPKFTFALKHKTATRVRFRNTRLLRKRKKGGGRAQIARSARKIEAGTARANTCVPPSLCPMSPSLCPMSL